LVSWAPGSGGLPSHFFHKPFKKEKEKKKKIIKVKEIKSKMKIGNKNNLN